ncbi:MAG: glycosyltransferase family 39 protein [bacterium]|nr:glycosyltransferase family 39 protein [bacterium]
MTAFARPLALLIAVSLAIRLGLCLAVVGADVPLLFDEADYFARALAWRQAAASLAAFEAPPAAALAGVYGHGHWPPFHPLLLGAGLTLGGPNVAVARLLTVLMSTLTTFLVYRFARELTSDRAAWTAAWLHALYPTFVAYSHYLWSETTYVCLLLAGLLATVRLPAADGRRRLVGAAVAGLALGLAVLTRTAALPFLLVVPAWLWLASGRRRIAVPAIVLASGLGVILPWQAVLITHEDRFVPLSTLGGYNLALGNNPWVPSGMGSSWGHEESKARLRDALESSTNRGDDWRAAGSSLALEEIRRRPGAALVRAIERLGMLWAPDLFPLRHLFHAVYPPVPPALAGWAALATLAAYLALLVLAVLGLKELRYRSLLLALLAAGMIPPVLTIGMPRLHLPLLALLLPAAGAGLALLTTRGSRRSWVAAGLIAVALALVLAGSLPGTVSTWLLPSSHYSPAVERADRLLGSRARFSDRVLLRRVGGTGELTVKLVARGLRFTDGSRQRQWTDGDGNQLRLDLFSTSNEPVEIEISSSAESIRLRPIATDAWRRWRSSGFGGVEVYWAGGG